VLIDYLNEGHTLASVRSVVGCIRICIQSFGREILTVCTYTAKRIYRNSNNNNNNNNNNKKKKKKKKKKKNKVWFI
jgi:hypothetical protein